MIGSWRGGTAANRPLCLFDPFEHIGIGLHGLVGTGSIVVFLRDPRVHMLQQRTAKMRQPRGAARELEDSVWREHGLPSWDDLRLPRGLHVDGARRPLRVPVEGASLRSLPSEDAIELHFELPAGSYATVLIEEIFAGEAIVEGAGDGGEAVVEGGGET